MTSKKRRYRSSELQYCYILISKICRCESIIGDSTPVAHAPPGPPSAAAAEAALGGAAAPAAPYAVLAAAAGAALGPARLPERRPQPPKRASTENKSV